MRYARAVLAFVAFACADFDLVLPEPRPPRLDVFVFSGHSDTTSIHVSIIMEPGVDSSGRPHRLADSIVSVNGEPVSPTSASVGGPIWQWVSEKAPVSTPDTLMLRFPVFAGQDSFAAARVVVPARLDPTDIAIASGEDLRLRLSPAPVLPGYQGVFSFWTLRVGEECGASASLEVEGGGEYPSEFRVPWEWIAAPAPFELEACLFVTGDYRSDQRTPASSLFLSISARWRVQVSP